MLEDLIIKNGSISPNFDKLINTYTVTCNSDVTYLILDYELSDEYNINIINNNNFIEGENLVTIEILYNNDLVDQYQLIVNKESTKASIDLTVYKPIDIENSEKLPDYVPISIIVLCVLMMLFIFKILFLRKKKMDH